MTALTITNDIFFHRMGLDPNMIGRCVDDTLSRVDDGELYMEYVQSESLTWDDSQLKDASFNTTQGLGMRGVYDESVAYAHTYVIDENAIRRAGHTVAEVRTGYTGLVQIDVPNRTNQVLYSDKNPLDSFAFQDKITLLQDIDRYARSLDVRVCQVNVSLIGEWKVVRIIRPGGIESADVRPLVRLSVRIFIQDGSRMESGLSALGGRTDYLKHLHTASWKECTDRAFAQASINLEARPAPAGEMTVVLGHGFPGILLHEAVGHGLEGDFNRKKTSAFSGLMGEKVASVGVTVIDDGSIPECRGSLTIDDEATPTQRTLLIEDGILVGYMQDRQNARLMNMKPTGNGRRQSFAHAPMPRMTNTFMLSGSYTPEEICAAVSKGLYAVEFSGGQVDITSGQFVFNASEAYLIEDGKIGAPVKGAMLIGNGPEVLKRVRMIGNDSMLDRGVGLCGKDGQWVPVGVGQPTLCIDRLTVGGTEV